MPPDVGKNRDEAKGLRRAMIASGRHENDGIATVDDRFLMVAWTTSKNNARWQNGLSDAGFRRLATELPK
jgi:hypothetical protein